jgi:hypothetical protein
LFEQYKKEKYTKYYSVSSGFCLYQAQPFRDGARYGYINKETGEPDCEMVVICQEFQERGHKSIYMANQAEMTHNHN